jgi:hypothetical protein
MLALFSRTGCSVQSKLSDCMHIGVFGANVMHKLRSRRLGVITSGLGLGSLPKLLGHFVIQEIPPSFDHEPTDCLVSDLEYQTVISHATMNCCKYMIWPILSLTLLTMSQPTTYRWRKHLGTVVQSLPCTCSQKKHKNKSPEQRSIIV